MSWTTNPVLLNQTAHTPPKEIFQGVCDEIGRHYEQRGFKYSRSRPKIFSKDEDFRVEVGFSSSHSNMAGSFVAMEIGGGIYSLKHAKKGGPSGLLLGGPFEQKYTDDKRKIRVVQIYGDVLERDDEYSHESVIKYNRSCNLYGIDEAKFLKIIEFIDTHILSWREKITMEHEIIELLRDPTGFTIWQLGLKEHGGNSSFVEYVKEMFPNIDLSRWRSS